MVTTRSLHGHYTSAILEVLGCSAAVSVVTESRALERGVVEKQKRRGNHTQPDGYYGIGTHICRIGDRLTEIVELDLQ